MNNRVSKVNPSFPLREPTLYIMLSLATGEKHGYAIMKEVDNLSQGGVHLSTGTLYEAIARLLDQGWISRAEEPEESDLPSIQGPPRKTYRLTKSGKTALEGEVGRLQKLVIAARQQLDQVSP